MKLNHKHNDPMYSYMFLSEENLYNEYAKQ